MSGKQANIPAWTCRELNGCAFCDAPPGTEAGEAHTGGQDERVTYPICVDCAIQTEPDPISAITTTVTAVDWSSTRSGLSPGSGSNWDIWKAHCNCALAVVPAGSQHTGRATSGRTSSQTDAPSSRRHG
ncbi:hypothetical protein GCM10009017_25310 [Halarchaeum rubridurum]|uniref:Uncharacterized protein n=1 Tax=Halarchaeum rubridurum TaxID=489911 RepID=A0A830G3J9_9EURY|nr:hypothetical protein GCM10009017_25310 [Halarchaeum rubridurum]